jgi:pSer/pThr/pTyr-binding forkhead associated (FHA) protein
MTFERWHKEKQEWKEIAERMKLKRVQRLAKVTEMRKQYDAQISKLRHPNSSARNVTQTKREAASEKSDLSIDRQRARQFAVGFLIVESPTGERRRKFFIPKGSSISIGRKHTSDVVINDQSVSHQAAMVVSDGPSIFVVDLCTKNGTFLNGVKLASGSRTTLKSGDQIGIGDSRLTFSSFGKMD